MHCRLQKGGYWPFSNDNFIWEYIFEVILVGNKCDMEDERVISYERGKQLADSLGLQFFETSAKENINVRVSWAMKISDLFDPVIKLIREGEGCWSK